MFRLNISHRCIEFLAWNTLETYWNLFQNTSIECQGDILGLWKARIFFLRRCVEVELFGEKKGVQESRKNQPLKSSKGTWDSTNYLEDLISKGLMYSSWQKPGCKPPWTVWNRIQNHAELLWEHRGCYPGAPLQDNRLLLKYASSWISCFVIPIILNHDFWRFQGPM